MHEILVSVYVLYAKLLKVPNNIILAVVPITVYLPFNLFPRQLKTMKNKKKDANA